MHTLLEDAHTWFLERLVYEGEVRAVVVEGIRAEKSEDVEIGEHVIKDCHALEVLPTSRRVMVQFARPVAWQVVDESYTAHDESEVRDEARFLSTLTQSAYLQYVKDHHGWFEDVAGPAAHYRLWTEDEVLDVVAHEAPTVQLLAES